MVVFEYCCTWFLLFDIYLSRPYHLCLTKCIPALLYIFQFINQPYKHWNVNTIYSLLLVSTLLDCHHQGILKSLKLYANLACWALTIVILHVLCVMHNSVYQTSSHSPKCEHNGFTISYIFRDNWVPWWWHSRSCETCRTLCIYCTSQFGACEFGLIHGILHISFLRRITQPTHFTFPVCHS